MDGDYLRRIITSQSEKRRIDKKGYREGPVKRMVRIMNEPVFILRRLVLYIGDQRCAVTLLALNLKLEGNLALEYYLNLLLRMLQGPGRPRMQKRIRSPVRYSRIVTTEDPVDEEEEEVESNKDEKMDVDITESDLEEAFARAVNIDGSEKGEEETADSKEGDERTAEVSCSQGEGDSSAVDRLESLLSELIEQELSGTCHVKQEREDEDEYLVQP